jgi:hypothetical protein
MPNGNAFRVGPATKLLFYVSLNLESKQSGRPGSYSSIHR